MITVTIYDGHYGHSHQLSNDADLTDLIEVLDQYRHSPVALPATALTIEKDDDTQCESCGEVGDDEEVFAYEIGQPQECSECRYQTEEEMTE